MQFSTAITRQFNLLGGELVAVYIVYYHMIHSYSGPVLFFLHSISLSLSLSRYRKVQDRCVTFTCASKHNGASRVHNEQIALELSEFHFIQREKQCAPIAAMCLRMQILYYMGYGTIRYTPKKSNSVPVYFVNSFFPLCLFVYKLNKNKYSLRELFTLFTPKQKTG